MASSAEKDILIEENAAVMAECKMDDKEVIKKCQELRDFLYATDERLIDFYGVLKLIQKTRQSMKY